MAVDSLSSEGLTVATRQTAVDSLSFEGLTAATRQAVVSLSFDDLTAATSQTQSLVSHSKNSLPLSSIIDPQANLMNRQQAIMVANDAQQDQLEALLQQIYQLNANNQGKAATQFSFKELTAYLNFNKEPCTSLRHPRHHWDYPPSTCQSTLIIVIRYMLLAFCSIISTPSPKVITKRIGNKYFHWHSSHWILYHPDKCRLYPGSTASASSTKSATSWRPVWSPYPRSRFSSNIWFQKELGTALERARRVEY